MHILPLDTQTPGMVEALLDRAFGIDRRMRTAYRVRGGVPSIPALSFAAVEDAALIASVQCWPIAFVADDGASTLLTMVGPVAVDPARQRAGIGRRLLSHALAAAERSNLADALMLIGDPEYYERFFGFSSARTAGWRLPGPFEAHRLLARGARIPDAAGMLGPIVP